MNLILVIFMLCIEGVVVVVVVFVGGVIGIILVSFVKIKFMIVKLFL